MKFSIHNPPIRIFENFILNNDEMIFERAAAFLCSAKLHINAEIFKDENLGEASYLWPEEKALLEKIIQSNIFSPYSIKQVITSLRDSSMNKENIDLKNKIKVFTPDLLNFSYLLISSEDAIYSYMIKNEHKVREDLKKFFYSNVKNNQNLFYVNDTDIEYIIKQSLIILRESKNILFSSIKETYKHLEMDLIRSKMEYYINLKSAKNILKPQEKSIEESIFKILAKSSEKGFRNLKDFIFSFFSLLNLILKFIIYILVYPFYRIHKLLI